MPNSGQMQTTKINCAEANLGGFQARLLSSWSNQEYLGAINGSTANKEEHSQLPEHQPLWRGKGFHLLEFWFHTEQKVLAATPHP